MAYEVVSSWEGTRFHPFTPTWLMLFINIDLLLTVSVKKKLTSFQKLLQALLDEMQHSPNLLLGNVWRQVMRI